MMTNVSSSDQYHELYLQRNGEKYYHPIFYQHGMDQRECDLYYNVMSAQQQGGSFRKPRECCKMASCLSSFPRSILRTKRPARTTHEQPRPALIRRVSYSDQLIGKEINPSNDSLRRSRSLSIIDHPRVTFQEQVHVITIHPIADMPPGVRSNLWMSRDELLVCMHEAAIEQMQEQMVKEEEEKSRRSLERLPSITSVLDCDVSYVALDSIVAPFLL